MWFILKLVQGFRWFKFSWEAYWFDHSYIERTLLWLLRHMGNKFIKIGHLQNSKKDGKDILKAADMLDRIVNNKIEEEIYDEHTARFPNKPKEIFDWTTENENDKYQELKHTKEYDEYAKTAEGKLENKEFRKLYKIIDKKIQKERDAFYSYLAKNIVNWWD